MHLQATLHGISRSDGRWKAADALLDRVGLTDAADRRIGTYSGGMRRRLDLATALVHEPRVLFLDEPTTGLDPVSRQAIWDEVRNLNDEGTTVFLTTQYLEEADQLADRVGIIDDGAMAAEGTPERAQGQVGHPHLELVARGRRRGARRSRCCRGSASSCPRATGSLQVSLERGAAQIAPIVVRALDEAGLAVESLDLVQPTLDDVFVAKTGRHLEGAEDGDEPRRTSRGGARRARRLSGLGRPPRCRARGPLRCGWSARSAGARSCRPSAGRSSSRRSCSSRRSSSRSTPAAPAAPSTCPRFPRSTASSTSSSPARCSSPTMLAGVSGGDRARARHRDRLHRPAARGADRARRRDRRPAGRDRRDGRRSPRLWFLGVGLIFGAQIEGGRARRAPGAGRSAGSNAMAFGGARRGARAQERPGEHGPGQSSRSCS